MFFNPKNLVHFLILVNTLGTVTTVGFASSLIFCYICLMFQKLQEVKEKKTKKLDGKGKFISLTRILEDRK